MKLVLDTNVLIAAFISRGVCHDLLEHCLRQHEIVTSDKLLTEFEEKLLHKFKVPAAEARETIDFLTLNMRLVTPEPLETAVCRDPDDDWVLATAAAGGCACIVTGDKDLLVLKEFQNIAILAPSDFWAYEAGRTDSA